jgi:hypothetical protein
MEAVTIFVLTLYVFITGIIFNKSIDGLIVMNRREKEIVETVTQTKYTRFGFGRQRSNSCPM